MESAVMNTGQAVSAGDHDGNFAVRPYRLRKLQAQDIPEFAKIIGRIGIDELVSCYGDDDFTELLLKIQNRKKRMEETEPEVAGDEWIMGIAVATRIANKLLQNLDRCMGDVFGLLGRLSGMKEEEVAALDLDVFIMMVTDVITGNNIVNFIRAAIKFI